MKYIYVVTSGDFSDYKINAIFTSKELAQSFIDKFADTNYMEFRIERYELNPYESAIRKNYNAYFVRMSKDGTCKDIYQSDTVSGFNDKIKYGFDVYNNMYYYVFAKDIKHAIKITNEKRVELIALNMWNEPKQKL